ncbi:MAG: Wzz/FepE/Etk N-terminal domain-containing protein [Verrucomicrobiota bacterium]
MKLADSTHEPLKPEVPRLESTDPPSPKEEGFQWFEMDESDLLFLIRRHFWLLLLLPLFCGGIAIGASSLISPVFTTSSVLYVRPNFDKEMQVEKTSSKLDDDDSLRSLEEFLVSDTVILRVVDRLGLRDDSSFTGGGKKSSSPLSDDALLKKVRDRYTTDLKPNTRLIELEVKDFSAQRTKLISETIVDEFLVQFRSERGVKGSDAREILVRQSEAALAETMKNEKELEAFRSAHPEFLVEQDSNIFHERLLQQGEILNTAKAEASRLEEVLAALGPIDPAEDPYRIFQILTNRNSEYLSDLLSMHAESQKELALIKERYLHRHPNHIAAVNQLEEVESTLKDYAAEMKEGVALELETAKRKAVSHEKTLAALQADFVTFKSSSAAFRGIKEKIDRYWNTYSALQQKIMDLDVDAEGTPSFVTVVSAPVVPDKKSHPRTLIWTAGGTLLGCLAAMGIVVLRNRHGLPFTNSKQPTELLRVPTIATLEIPPKGTLLEKTSRLQKSPQLLNLLIAVQRFRCIHVSSCEPDSPAPLLSFVLGRTLAKHDLKTLLITFSHETNKSLNAVRDSSVTNLSLVELSSVHLLNMDDFRTGLRKAMEKFDRVIADTTQIHETETSLAVSQEAEANLIVVVEQEGKRADAEYYVERCRDSGIESTFGVYLRESESRQAAGGKKKEKERPTLPWGTSPASLGKI